MKLNFWSVFSPPVVVIRNGWTTIISTLELCTIWKWRLLKDMLTQFGTDINIGSLLFASVDGGSLPFSRSTGIQPGKEV
jgi:hypothetical protein